MRIGIDARVLQTPLLYRGIGVYTYNIIKNLLHLYPDEDFVFYIFKGKPYPGIIKDYEKVGLKRYSRYNWFWQQFIEFKTNVDVFHFTLGLGPSLELVVPIFQPCRTVATVYDLIPLHLTDSWSLYLSHSKEFKLQRYSIRKVKQIITISYWSKSDIINKLRISPDKIKVIYPGVDREIFKPQPFNHSIIREKYKIDSKFILTVGEFTNKNLKTSLCAYIKIREKGLKFVIVGSEANCSSDVKQLLKNSTLKGEVIFTGVISDTDLANLYRAALLFLFPSLVEGFGLPPLEAMSCGCPVIASNSTGIPEVVDRACILVNPEDEESIIKAMTSLIYDNKLRENFIKMGLDRGSQFSWKRAAEATFRTYMEVYNS
ncbi:MAG: glycosyltransferase family 1 protein [bacterium]|nr:glycosyltransferase family 1 protein [bacterium]